MKYKEQAELVQSLRELADFLETSQALALPKPSITVSSWVSHYDWVNGKYEQDEAATKAEMRNIAKALGYCDKEYSGDTFKLRRKFGSIVLTYNSARSAVCERVVVGTKEIDKYEKVGKEIVDDVQWVCTDSLLAS